MPAEDIISSLKDRVLVMGILNVTPDSFSDGGLFFDTDKAVAHALAMVRDGADIIDIGGESTRPGAEDITADEECARIIPAIKRIASAAAVPISVDTRKSVVAEEAIRAGASIVNDVSGLHYDGALASAAARHGSALILMHMKGTPRDMQADPRYGDVVKDVIDSLRASVSIAKRAGVRDDRIIVDPGIGFGKTLQHNLELLNRLDEFKVLGLPVCVGTSRKSFIGKALDIPDPGDRLAGTIATCVIAVMKGARVLRVHDVRQAAEAARISGMIIGMKAD
jgi:dihydropteroate synthase